MVAPRVWVGGGGSERRVLRWQIGRIGLRARRRQSHIHAAVSFLGSGSGPSFVQFIRHFIRTAPQKNVHTLLLTSDVTSDAQCDTQWEHHAASRDAQRAGGNPLGGRIVELHANAAAAAATAAAAPPE